MVVLWPFSLQLTPFSSFLPPLLGSINFYSHHYVFLSVLRLFLSFFPFCPACSANHASLRLPFVSAFLSAVLQFPFRDCCHCSFGFLFLLVLQVRRMARCTFGTLSVQLKRHCSKVRSSVHCSSFSFSLPLFIHRSILCSSFLP